MKLKIKKIDKEKMGLIKNKIDNYFKSNSEMLLKDNQEIERNIKNIQEKGKDNFLVYFLFIQQFYMFTQLFELAKLIGNEMALSWIEKSKEKLGLQTEELEKLFNVIQERKEILKNKSNLSNEKEKELENEIKSFSLSLLSVIKNIDENIFDKEFFIQDFNEIKDDFQKIDLKDGEKDKGMFELFATSALKTLLGDPTAIQDMLLEVAIDETKDVFKDNMKENNVKSNNNIINNLNNITGFKSANSLIKNIDTNKNKVKNIQRQKV